MSAQGVIAIRVLVIVWLAALTVILLVSGHWGWAIVTGAGAVANAVFIAYRIRRKGSS
jgi:hypothetical protein